MIEANIIKDSINPSGSRLTTFVLTYPRFIHSELMTHRVFSRNASSSRAIPFSRMVKMVEEDTAMPVKWGSHQKGMQTGDEIEHVERAQQLWLSAMKDAVSHAERLHNLGIHKSICNRLLEPFAHITTIVSATEFENFFKLRAHPDAEPTFQALAYLMKDRYEKVENLTALEWGEWHVPFDIGAEFEKLPVSTARCARVSYLTFNGQQDPREDIRLHDQLVNSGHWSPFEHCARAVEIVDPLYQSNFLGGWVQYRKFFVGEDGRS